MDAETGIVRRLDDGVGQTGSDAMLRLSANLSTMFQELPFLERFAAARLYTWPQPALYFTMTNADGMEG